MAIGLPSLDQLRQDLRFAVSLMRRSPGFTAVAVLSLALGIGANTALFSVVNTLLIKALPYQDADRLVYVTEYWPREPVVPGPPSPDFANWRANSKLAEAIAAYGGGADALNLIGSGEPERLQGTMVTRELLDLIGAKLAIGRNFSHDEDRPGGPPAVILGYALWQRKFAASPEVIGTTIRLNGLARTIVGVLPSGFAFPDNNFRHEILVPMALPADLTWRDANFRLLRVIARMRPGVSPVALGQELAELRRAAISGEPAQMATMRKDMEVRVTPLRDWLTGGVRRQLLVLQATVAMLLLIACLNIAALQVARAANRQKEMALRIAVGAGRGRLIRQLLTENLVLSGVGGGLGLLAGYWSLGPLRAFLPANLHLAAGIRIETAVLWFALGAAALTGMVVGAFPAMLATRARVSGRSPQHVHGALVAAEIAVAMVLLVGSALFVRTFVRAASAHPGFRAEGVLTMKVSRRPAKQTADFFVSLVDHARTIPGVESAAVGGGLPLIGTRAAAGVSIMGEPDGPPGSRPSIPVAGVTSEYFRALGIPIVRGRAFTAADEKGPSVAIVNQAFAERFFPGRDALGKRIEFGSREGFWREIVGIAGNVKQQGRRSVDPFIIYSPLTQLAEPDAFLILRTAGAPPEALTSAARAAVHAVDRNQPVYDVATMEERLGLAISTQRASMTLMGVFAILALLLASIGIFGMMAYFVSRSKQEIGIRVALGATRGDVLRMVLRRGMLLAGAGIVIGLGGALALARMLGGLVEGVKPQDPAAYAAAAIVFTLVSVAACLIPATDAARVDPLQMLRTD